MANKTTLTQVQALTSAIDFINGVETDVSVVDVVAKLTAMRDTLSNKSHSVNKAEMAKRSVLSEMVISALSAMDKPVTVSELQRSDVSLQSFENGEIISGQRITSILTALVKDGRVTNTKDKKKSYFSLVK